MRCGDSRKLQIFASSNANRTSHPRKRSIAGDGIGDAPTDGWTFELTTGSEESQGDGFIELSDDSAGTITLDDGTSLIFDGVERFIW